jgi:hypothetical protein
MVVNLSLPKRKVREIFPMKPILVSPYRKILQLQPAPRAKKLRPLHGYFMER